MLMSFHSSGSRPCCCCCCCFCCCCCRCCCCCCSCCCQTMSDRVRSPKRAMRLSSPILYPSSWLPTSQGDSWVMETLSGSGTVLPKSISQTPTLSSSWINRRELPINWKVRLGKHFTCSVHVKLCELLLPFTSCVLKNSDLSRAFRMSSSRSKYCFCLAKVKFNLRKIFVKKELL